MIELRTLGSVDLRAADGREILSVLAQPKRLALLTYLAVAAPGGFVRRDALLAMFWPGSTDQRARGAFRQAVLYLRRSLGEGVIVNRAEDEVGIADAALRCDAVELREARGRGAAARAWDLYGGPFLAGLHVAGAPAFERWVAEERRALEAEAVAAAWSLVDRADGGTALEWARRAVGLAPLDESGVRRWMALLDGAGDRAGAVRAYEDLALGLAEELGLKPSPETRALVEEIRGRDATPAPPVRTPTPPHAPGRAPIGARSWRASSFPPATRFAIALAVAAIALSGLAYLALPRTAPPTLEPRRVLVLPFANTTGESALDPVATMAADWILQGLAGRGSLEIVPVTASLTRALHLSEEADSRGADPDPRPLAVETGAGTAVSGSYYRQGDSLHYQARVTDVATGRVIAAIGPVRSSADAPLDGVHTLRERVLAVLAPLSDERDTHVRRTQVTRAPPAYEAYDEYVSGFEAFVRRQDVPGAMRHFERAAATDPTFRMPAISAAIMHVNLGNYAAADSIARITAEARDELGPWEVATLDMVLAWTRGDHGAAYGAALRLATLAPGSIGEYQMAEQARRLNRPGETVLVLSAMGAERGDMRGWFPYWRELAIAHHMLGDHRAELNAARRARQLYPTSPWAMYLEVQALAALGRVNAVHRIIEERLNLTSPSPDFPTPGALMAAAARELRAHGHRDAADLVFDRSIAWYRTPRSGEPSVDPRPGLASVLYEAGRWDEAKGTFTALAAEDPENMIAQGYLGVLAARLGGQAESARIDAWLRDLERPLLRGRHTLWRARIAAVLGERDRAVELLRQAFAEGIAHGAWENAQGVPWGTMHHADADLLALRDHAPFRALVEPVR